MEEDNEDIDVLLEEFENDFINNQTESNMKIKNSSKAAKSKLLSDMSLDVDDILSMDLGEQEDTAIGSKWSKQVEKTVTKCYPTFIGGSAFPFGCTRPGMTRTCSKLFCSNCDFKISHYIDYEWIEHVEYLFLRINMPQFEKIKEKLKMRKGSNAYACHCISYSTRTLEALYAVPFLPWFCKGHPG